jgi:hypothetical protein
MRTIHAAALGLALVTTSATADNHPAWRTGGIGERIAVAAKVHVIPEAVIEDSRCPADVLCVTAGRLVLKVQVHYADGAVPVILTLGAPQAVGPDKLVLETVTPETATTGAILPQDYRFTFTYLQAR